MSLTTIDVTHKEPVNVTPMSVEEARDCTELIRKDLAMLETVRMRLLDMERRQGFKALKYSTWREWATKEYSHASQAYLYRLLAAAKVEVNLAANSTIVENIPIAQLTELAKLPPSQQPEALRKADELAMAENKPRTTRHVTKVVNQLMPSKEPKLLKHQMSVKGQQSEQNVETSPTALSWQSPVNNSVAVCSEKEFLGETNFEIFDSPESEVDNEAFHRSLVAKQNQLLPDSLSPLNMNKALPTSKSPDTLPIEQINSLSVQQVVTMLKTFERRLGAETFNRLIVEITSRDGLFDLCNKCLNLMDKEVFSQLAVEKINFSGLSESALTLLSQKSQYEIDKRSHHVNQVETVAIAAFTNH